ncbi:MAG: hypothetical protein ACE5LB_09070, partial [Acidiferrobacterales bacterium]
MRTTFCSKGCALLFVIVLGLPALAWAQDKKPLPDRFHAELGPFIVTNANTVVELAAVAGPITAGTRIDFEDDLNIDDSDVVPRLDGYFRFGKRSRIDFTYWKIDRDGTTVTPFTIDFGDINIPAGTTVNSFFDEELINLSYGFSFYNVPKAELGLKAGLFIADIGVGIEVVGGTLSESETVTLPLPVLGAYFRYDMGKRWRFRGDAQVFFLETDDFEGSLSDLRLSVEHQTFRHLGFGFGFNRIATSLEVNDDDFRGEVGT